jgi:hypothetical protein
MTQAMRAHGNAAEYIPIWLILLYTLTQVAALGLNASTGDCRKFVTANIRGGHADCKR